MSKETETLCRLGDKMTSLAQFDKQRALAALSAALVGSDLQAGCDTLEAPHRILAMLYHASSSPVNAYYTPGPLAHQLCQEQTGRKNLGSCVGQNRAGGKGGGGDSAL